MELVVYSLNNCYYSEGACKYLDDLKKIYRKISINNNDKSYYKKKNNMNSFPQIFLENKTNNIKIKIGGFDDLKNIHEIIKNNKLYDDVYEKLDNMLDLKRKHILKIIKFFLNNI